MDVGEWSRQCMHVMGEPQNVESSKNDAKGKCNASRTCPDLCLRNQLIDEAGATGTE